MDSEHFKSFPGDHDEGQQELLKSRKLRVVPEQLASHCDPRSC